MNNQCIMLNFLGAPTSKLWFEQASQNLDMLLIDHAHCERKAAQFALKLVKANPDKLELIQSASRLAREELVHFERVLKIIQKRNIAFKALSSSGYASGLQKQAIPRQCEERLIYELVIAAFIEARSCERFLGLVPYLDPQLADFYERLAIAEQRHYELYVDFAKNYSTRNNIDSIISEVRAVENRLISEQSLKFRFHSGPTALIKP